MADLPKVCEYLHLPIQAGSDRVLTDMNRGYTSGDYLKKIDRLKESIPEIALSTDIIIGFPGETDGDFEKTRDIVKKVCYDGIYLFKYSPRKETPAAIFSNQLSDTVKRARFEEILKLQKEITLKKNKELEGKVVEVLVEGEDKNANGKLIGRTRTNKIVNFSIDMPEDRKSLIGELVNVSILKSNLYSLEGILINIKGGGKYA